jgi:hypothetical protein
VRSSSYGNILRFWRMKRVCVAFPEPSRVRLHPRRIRGPGLRRPGSYDSGSVTQFRQRPWRRLHSCGTAPDSNRLRCSPGTRRFFDGQDGTLAVFQSPSGRGSRDRIPGESCSRAARVGERHAMLACKYEEGYPTSSVLTPRVAGTVISSPSRKMRTSTVSPG